MWYPGAVDKRLPENATQRKITPRTVIFHTMVGSLRGTDSHFRHYSSLESHFGVGGPWDGSDLDGIVWQWIDTNVQADCNREANAFAISIETADGARSPIPPWSDKQVQALIELGKWAHKVHGIPLRLCRDPYDGGYGYHALFTLPGPWGPTAKPCPTAPRIAQLRNIILPAIFKPISNSPAKPVEPVVPVVEPPVGVFDDLAGLPVSQEDILFLRPFSVRNVIDRDGRTKHAYVMYYPTDSQAKLIARSCPGGTAQANDIATEMGFKLPDSKPTCGTDWYPITTFLDGPLKNVETK